MTNIKNIVSENLANAALSYYLIGTENFHKEKNKGYLNFQATLGNLSISIELMLKAIIAKKCIKFLYANIPLEVQLKLTYPKAIEPLNQLEKVDLESFTYKTIQIDNCISIFYSLFPELKQEYKPYFALFSSIRNKSVHAAFPQYKKYDFERVAYLTFKLFKFCKSLKFKALSYWNLNKEDKLFLNSFYKEKVEYIKKKIEIAQKQSKKISSTIPITHFATWGQLIIKCPVCKNDSELLGDLSIFENEFYKDELILKFNATHFHCKNCCLELENYEELRLASVETEYDISERLEDYLSEFHQE
jgi:hypothetical protein